MLLSLTGTVIRDQEGRTTVHKPLCISQEWFLRMIGVHKGPLLVYTCQDHSCITLATHDTLNQSSLHEKIIQFCHDIQRKIQAGTPLSSEDVALIEHCRVPILKLMTVNLLSHEEVIPLSEIVDVIVFDIVMRWVEKMLQLVDEAVHYVRAVQIDDTPFKLFTKNMQQTRQFLHTAKKGFYQHLRSVISLVDRARLLEQRALAYGTHLLSEQQSSHP